MKFHAHPYQQEAIEFGLYRFLVEEQLGSGLFLDPGLGKTAVTLSVIKELRQHLGRPLRVLVIAPLRVIAKTWPDEIKKWGFCFTTQIVQGSTKKTKLLKPAEIYLINPEGVAWLEKQPNTRFDLLVVDESTKFKTWSAKRTKALRKLLPRCKRRMILTGTPSPLSAADLFSQLYVLDDGATLGKSITAFRSIYMEPGGFQGKGWKIKSWATNAIAEKIAPLVLTLKAEDHLSMPPLVHNVIWVDLPPGPRRVYDQIEKKLFTQLESGIELGATSAGALYSLCRGLANGGAYYREDDPLNLGAGARKVADLHEAKTEAIEDLIEELSGKSAIIAYQYNHDSDRLLRRFPKAPVIRGGQSLAEFKKTVDAWNAGKVPVLLVQPQALSHGANMQAGGNDLIWCGLTDQLEVYLQLNARIYRQGVVGQVRIHHVLARNTVDEAVWANIRHKTDNQETLLASLREYQAKKGTT